jgi:hypothetical protein
MLALRYLLLCLCLHLISDLNSVMAVRPHCRPTAVPIYGQTQLLHSNRRSPAAPSGTAGETTEISHRPYLRRTATDIQQLATSHCYISLPHIIATSHYHIPRIFECSSLFYTVQYPTSYVTLHDTQTLFRCIISVSAPRTADKTFCCTVEGDCKPVAIR